MGVRVLAALAVLVLSGCHAAASPSPVAVTGPASVHVSPAVVTTAPSPSPSAPLSAVRGSAAGVAAASSPVSPTVSLSPNAARPTAAAERQLRLAVVGSATNVGALAAYAGTVYVMRVTEGPRPAMSITAIDATGRTRTSVIRTGEVAQYYQYLAAGPEGIYASTSVIRRFSRVPDEVVRVNPRTLRLTRRVAEAVPEGPFVTPTAVYLELSASTIARVDPVTLAVRASYSGLLQGDPPQPADNVPDYAQSYGLTLGEGALWLIHGDARGGTVFHLDPVSLRRLPGSWKMPVGQGGDLVGTPSTVWRVTQKGVVRLLPGGRVRWAHLGRALRLAVVRTPACAVAAAGGPGLVRGVRVDVCRH